MGEESGDKESASVEIGRGGWIPPSLSGLFESPATRERRERGVRTAGRIAAFAGIWGIVSGFALFVTVDTQDNRIVGAELVLAALAAMVIEWLRGRAAGRSDGARLSLPHLLSTILVLVTFELFVMSVSEVGSQADEWSDILGNVFGVSEHEGRSLGVTRAGWNFTGFVLTWVSLGAVVGFDLGRAVDRLPPATGRAVGLGLAAGLKAALVHVPLVVFAWSLLIRITWAGWVSLASGHWEAGGALADGLVPLLLCGGVALALRSPKSLPVTGIAVVALLVYRHGLQLRTWGDETAGALVAAGHAALVWGVPAVVLGGLLPLLRRPSDFRWAWSPIAALLAVLCMALAIWRHSAWLIAAVILLAAAAVLFRRSERLEELWPLLAGCGAFAAFGLTSVVHGVTGLGIYRNLQTVVNPSFQPQYGIIAEAMRREPGVERIRALRAVDPDQLVRVDAMGNRFDVDGRLIGRVDSRPGMAPVSGDAVPGESGAAAAVREALRGQGEVDGDRPGDNGSSDRPDEGALAPERNPEDPAGPKIPLQPGPLLWPTDPSHPVRSHRATVEAFLDQAIAFEIAMLGHDPDRKDRQGNPVGADRLVSRGHSFELATVGSLSFWVTIGLLAAWQIRRREDPTP